MDTGLQTCIDRRHKRDMAPGSALKSIILNEVKDLLFTAAKADPSRCSG